jgi:hypothetical protein
MPVPFGDRAGSIALYAASMGLVSRLLIIIDHFSFLVLALG